MHRTTAGILITALLVTLAAIAGWYHAHQALQASRARFLAGNLVPLATLLKENEAILTELQGERYRESDAGVLESYLIKIRRDGVAAHADMKQRLDQLSENNAAIVALLKAYAPQAKTEALSTQGDRFRNYASAWRDRWNSVMELFMAGGNYPTAGVPFPETFPAAVQAEMVAVR